MNIFIRSSGGPRKMANDIQVENHCAGESMTTPWDAEVRELSD